MRRTIWLMAAVVVGILLSLGGLAIVLLSSMTSSASGTLATGRSISATAQSAWLQVAYSQDTATIHAGDTEVVVAPGAIYLNNQPWGTLDPRSKNVEVTIQGDRLTVLADGQAVKEDSADVAGTNR